MEKNNKRTPKTITFDLKDYLEKKFFELKSDIKDVRGEVKDVRGEVKDVRGEVKEVRSEIKHVEGKVDRLNENLHGEIKEVENKVDRLNENFHGEIKEVENKVDRLSENHMKHQQQSINWLIGIDITLIGIGTSIGLAILGVLVKLAFFSS